MRNITISPISGNVKNNSHIDYKEQLLRTKSLLDGDAFWCWDDSKYNKAKEDELFAFFFTSLSEILKEFASLYASGLPFFLFKNEFL